jgi:hypothetical protein
VVDLLEAVGRNATTLIPVDDVTGQPLFNWCLVIVEALDHTAALADASVDATPDVALDVKWNAISQAVRNVFKNKLQARYGFTVAELGGLDNADGYREVIRAIGQKLDPTFNENAFDARAIF